MMAKIHLRDFPDDLHKELKVQAAKEGKFMYRVIEEAVRLYLEGKTPAQRHPGGSVWD